MNSDSVRLLNIPVLPLRGVTVFPSVLFHFDVGRRRSVKALEKAMNQGQHIFLLTQRDNRVEDPEPEDLFEVGTFCMIKQILKIPGDSVRVLVEGISRGRVKSFRATDPFMVADIELVESKAPARRTKRDIAVIRSARELFMEYAGLVPRMNGEIFQSIMDSDDMGYLADYIAQNIQLKYQDKQRILELTDARRRLTEMVYVLQNEIEILELEQELQDRVKEQVDRNQRDYYLREQAKVINEELGEGEDTVSESQEYIERIKALSLDAESEEKLIKEARRLARMQSSSPETGVIRTWLDTCLDLPWHKVSKENGDIAKAAAVLDADHYGLEKVKERILEFFAVKTLTGGVKGQIICLVGPPGVGKTSVARSIARSMGRSYARLSLGGVRDEADIRGHRKTYIGAMPGRIITALRQAKTRNCLILIDEIDKLGADYKGDPSSALLEVFDSEQNVAFRDHFVELPFDLSDVLFITTANSMETIPAPLLDRMELIQLGSYTDEEKLEIVRRHILPKQIKKHGLRASTLKLDDAVLRLVITGYTREAGVRSLERQLARLCRKVAKYITETGKKSLTFTAENLHEYLGTPKFKQEKPIEIPECGVVNGLAWTQSGGDMLEVECALIKGKGKLELTGNLGDVMKESARAAITYLRSRMVAFGLPEDFHSANDIHIHFPEGAIPKDGPSAGITTATALYSAITGAPVGKDIAMTGEISLRGRVLPIGGLKEKTMAAFRNGVKTVLIPAENQPDLDDIDQKVREKLDFIFVSHMDEVVAHVFGCTVQVDIPKVEPELPELVGIAAPAQDRRPGVRQ